MFKVISHNKIMSVFIKANVWIYLQLLLVLKFQGVKLYTTLALAIKNFQSK